jgi:hypothetical protein
MGKEEVKVTMQDSQKGRRKNKAKPLLSPQIPSLGYNLANLSMHFDIPLLFNRNARVHT